MWYEVLVGGLVGFATYLYLHYLQKRRLQGQLEERVAEDAVRNANESQTEKESVRWLNFLIKHWYLYVDEALQTKVKGIVQPILDDIDLPAGAITDLELESLSFGQHPPTIQYVKSVKDHWEDDENLQALELVLGPRIDAKEFTVRLKVGGLGTVEVRGFEFVGELQVTMLMDQRQDFPCIRHIFANFQERPTIKFDIEYGLIGMDVIPGIKQWLLDMIEEVVSDTLVDPGRFLIDLTGPKPSFILIKGVRKLKRTVLHIQVDITKNQVHKSGEKKRTISCVLDSGGMDHDTRVEFRREKKTVHIWYPLAVLQEEIRLRIINVVPLYPDEVIAEMVVDINSLVNNKTRELNRIQSPKLNLCAVVKATGYELPYIPLRQSIVNKAVQVKDYSDYFKIPQLTREDVMQCPSGLVYLHIHRATGLPAKDQSTGLSDPYCKIKLGDEKLFKTKTVFNNLSPIFNHFEDIFVPNILQTELLIEVVDYDRGRSNDEIGHLKLKLRDIAPKIVDKPFVILGPSKKPAGHLYLSVIFRPINFPPISENVSQNLINNIGKITILQ